MVSWATVGFVNRNDNTVYQINLPQNWRIHSSAGIDWIIHISKQDFKKDFWFFAVDNNLYLRLCRARVNPVGPTVTLDSIVVIPQPIPAGFQIKQITADYNTQNPVGGNVYATFWDQLGTAGGVIKFNITQDSPLQVTMTVSNPIADVEEVRGCALNIPHTRLTVAVIRQGALQWYLFDVTTSPPTYLSMSLPSVQPVDWTLGHRVETDMWLGSPNYGWQVTCQNWQGQVEIAAFRPFDGAMQSTLHPLIMDTGVKVQCALAYGGVLWVMRQDVVPNSFYTTPPTGGGMYLWNGISPPTFIWPTGTGFPAPVPRQNAMDVYKSGNYPNDDKWIGHEDGQITKFVPPPGLSAVTVYTHPENRFCNVSCPREPQPPA